MIFWWAWTTKILVTSVSKGIEWFMMSFLWKTLLTLFSKTIYPSKITLCLSCTDSLTSLRPMTSGSSSLKGRPPSTSSRPFTSTSLLPSTPSASKEKGISAKSKTWGTSISRSTPGLLSSTATCLSRSSANSRSSWMPLPAQSSSPTSTCLSVTTRATSTQRRKSWKKSLTNFTYCLT